MSADASPSKRPTGVLVGLAALAVCAAVIFLIRRGSEGVDPEDLEGLTTREVSVVPGTETATPRDAADKDGWTSEVFADVALAKLEEIGKLLEKGQPIQAASIARFLDDGFRYTPLRPAKLSETFADSAFVVWRAGEEIRSAPASLDGTAFGRSLNASLLPVEDPSDVHTKLKVVGVDLEADGDRATTDVLAQVNGRHAGGTFQVKTTWRITWSSADASADPRLVELRVDDYEAISGLNAGGPMFADCTESVLSKNSIFDSQLRPGIDHWLARVDIRFGLDIGGWQGLAIADINGDGLDDIYVSQPGGLPNRLFVQNPDGTATETSAAANVDWLESSHGSLFIDLDNDGDQDLLAGVDHGVLIQENDGSGVFKPRGSLHLPAAIPYSIAAADYDNDGDLDFYVCCYNRRRESNQHLVFARPVPYHDANNGGRNALFRNEGSFRFSHQTKRVGLDENNRRFSYAATWEDYDDDGDADLYVANDFGRNNLYRNDGGRFVDVSKTAGVEDISPGMSASWGDYDNDGKMDLYISNMFSSAGNRITSQSRFHAGTKAETRAQFRRHARGNTLLRNLGNGRFEDVSENAGVVIGRWAWGSRFIDLNNDGWQDLLVTNGFITQGDADDL
jgi:hypothetical protein